MRDLPDGPVAMTSRYRNDGEPAFPVAGNNRQDPLDIPERGYKEDVMDREGQSRRRALALARRDLLADWRNWSTAEKSAAVAGLATVALTPILAWIGLLGT